MGRLTRPAVALAALWLAAPANAADPVAQSAPAKPLATRVTKDTDSHLNWHARRTAGGASSKAEGGMSKAEGGLSTAEGAINAEGGLSVAKMEPALQPVPKPAHADAAVHMARSTDPLDDPFGDAKRESGVVLTNAVVPTDDPITDPFAENMQLDNKPADPKSAEPKPAEPKRIQSAPPITAPRVNPAPGAPALGRDLPAPGAAPSMRSPTLEELAQQPAEDLKLDCDTEYGRLKSIHQLTDVTKPEAGDFPPECSLRTAAFEPRNWSSTTYTWKASGLCHKPLYFEDVALERYGHSLGPVLQPVASGAHFFATVPLLPYKMGVEPAWECVYPLGYYRPGDCAPYMLEPFPISLQGAATEAAFITGLVYLIP